MDTRVEAKGRTLAATILSVALFYPGASSSALEWKSPHVAQPTAADEALAVVPLPPPDLPTPAIPAASEPTNADAGSAENRGSETASRKSANREKVAATKTSAQSRILEPDVGLSERQELSNGAELVWVTDQSAAQQRQPAKPTKPAAAKPQSQRSATRPASLDTASALNSKALSKRTDLAHAETNKSTATAANNTTANKSNACVGSSNSCCSSTAKDCNAGGCGADGCCGEGCGRAGCRGCGRLGCRGCGLCRRGDYMDRHANCSCDGSYKFPVPPLYTYHWPGVYSQQLMTDYHSPWRYPPLRPYTDEPTDDQLAPLE